MYGYYVLMADEALIKACTTRSSNSQLESLILMATLWPLHRG